VSGTSLRAGDVVRIRDESWIVLRHAPGADGAILDVRGRDRSNLGLRTSFLLPCEPIERLPMSGAPRIVRPPRWRRLARAVLAASTPSYDALRSPVRANLTILPFQLEPALACVRGLAARILIADEVGLGKTIQAGLLISELLDRRPGGRVLVVSPAGLREQWQSELRTRFAIEAAVLDSATLARHAGTWNANPWSAHPVAITSLDYVKRPEVARSLESLVWDVVVFDEAHALSGRSDRATVAAALAHRARTLVLLTATPHSGDDEAFARLCSIGDLSHQFPLLVFRRTRTDAGLASSRRTASIRVACTPAESEMHRALMSYARLVWNQKSASSLLAGRLAVTVLTRRACSSAASLARSVERRLRVLTSSGPAGLLQMVLPFGRAAEDDEEPSTDLTAPGLDDRDEECRWLEHILQLARLAERGESKLRALARLLRRTGESAIVFTEYRDTLDRLDSVLRDLDPVRLHGGLTIAERHEVLQQFTTGGTRLLLATDAASEGLNLHQRCRLVINLELPWTPVRLEQRIGRVERLGQARRVHAIHLLARDTCEEMSVAALLARMRRVAEVLGSMRGAAALEQQVAAVAIGQDTLPDTVDSSPPSLPRGLVHIDLRAVARAEASRLETARLLARGGGNAQSEGRPYITLVTRRRSRPRFCWAFQLIFEDLDQQRIWDTLLGITGYGAAMPPFAAKDVRSWVQSSTDLISPVLTAEYQSAIAALSASLRAPSALAVRREHAIATTLESQRARLSAALLQPGLFDRRAERATIAQRAVLDEALARCSTRLEELARFKRIEMASPVLAFGVIYR
jgi:superfamily II DNA or RNA helicase